MPKDTQGRGTLRERAAGRQLIAGRRHTITEKEPMARAFAFGLLLAGTMALPLAGQQRAPRRPRLPADADTNDAAAYFQLGLQRIERDPTIAADAFYWAAHLDPMSPQALYARGVALLLKDPQRLVKYQQRDSRTLGLAAVRGIDSLRFLAEMQDPFLHRGLEEIQLFQYAKNATHSEEWFGSSSNTGAGTVAGDMHGGSAGASRSSGIASSTERFLEENDQLARAQLYYSQGELRNALQYLAIGNRNREQDWVFQERARIFVEMRQLDSAAAMMWNALRLRQGPNDDWSRHMYETHAAWQFAHGRILEDRRDTAGARAAYERSIAADPNYYPALLRLGLMALTQGDSAGASGVLRRVVDRPDVQFFACAVAATVYNRMGRRDNAIAALRKATEIEPLASAGWLMLARTYETAQDTTNAVAAYEKFVALSARADAARPTAELSLARLRGSH
jgi:tetratricopeptide (TPR) repeat protein